MLVNEKTFNAYTNAPAEKDAQLDYTVWAAREQVRLLRAINGKLSFFVVLTIISIIVALFR